MLFIDFIVAFMKKVKTKIAQVSITKSYDMQHFSRAEMFKFQRRKKNILQLRDLIKLEMYFLKRFKIF